MLIKFKKPDPRAGTVAQMDSSRGQFFIDNGSADKVKDGAATAGGSESNPPPGEPEGGPKPSEGLNVAQLKEALTAKGLAIPEGAKKQDLADLLDGAT